MPSNYLPDTNQTTAEFNQSRDFTVSQESPQQLNQDAQMRQTEPGLQKDITTQLGKDAGRATTDYATKHGAGAGLAAILGTAVDTGINAVAMLGAAVLPKASTLDNPDVIKHTAAHLDFIGNRIQAMGRKQEDRIIELAKERLSRTDPVEAQMIELKARGHGAGVENQLWQNRDAKIIQDSRAQVQSTKKQTEDESKLFIEMSNKMKDSTPAQMKNYLLS